MNEGFIVKLRLSVMFARNESFKIYHIILRMTNSCSWYLKPKGWKQFPDRNSLFDDEYRRSSAEFKMNECFIIEVSWRATESSLFERPKNECGSLGPGRKPFQGFRTFSPQKTTESIRLKALWLWESPWVTLEKGCLFPPIEERILVSRLQSLSLPQDWLGRPWMDIEYKLLNWRHTKKQPGWIEELQISPFSRLQFILNVT
jgi:hypothetical protein